MAEAKKRKMVEVGAGGELVDPSKLVQGSKEWLEWRKGGIGASDAAAVLGQSPWTTRFQLWAQKSGLLEAPEPHPNAAAAMKRGQDLEPILREKYNKQTGRNVQPITLKHPQYPQILCSLDGWEETTRHMIEGKCPGKADLQLARKGVIPVKYQWQMVHQCIVADPLTADYVTYDGKEELIIIPFQRDPEKEAMLLKELLAFWDLVVAGQAPEVSVSELRDVAKETLKQMQRLAKLVGAMDLLSSILNDEDVIDV